MLADLNTGWHGKSTLIHPDHYYNTAQLLVSAGKKMLRRCCPSDSHLLQIKWMEFESCSMKNPSVRLVC